MKRRILAILVALCMLLCATAFAENSVCYTVAVVDPVANVYGQTIDLTGIDLELSGMVTDSGLTGVMLAVNSGETHANQILKAIAQLDANGLSIGADGITDIYSIDVNKYADTDVFAVMSQLPLYTILTTADFAQIVAQSGMTDQANALLTAIMAECIVAADETSVTISISPEKSEEIIAAMNQGANMEINVNFTMDGVIAFPAEGEFTVDLAGDIISEDESVPYTLTVNDKDGNGAYAMLIAEGMAAIQGEFTVAPVDDAHGAFELTGNVTVGNEVGMTYGMNVTAAEDGSDLAITLTGNVPSEDAGMMIALNFDQTGFALLVSNQQGEETYDFSMAYTGEYTEIENGGAINGALSIGLNANGQEVGLDTGIVLAAQTCDSSEWALTDTANTIDIENISEEQMENLQNEAMTLAFGALGTLSTDAPALMEMISGLIG